jgi:hypothetical protein
MKGVWWRADSNALQQLKNDLAVERLPLEVSVQGRIVFLRGVFPLFHEGETLDEYDIELEIAEDFPESIPKLRETGGRIPRNPERHVEQSGVACPVVPEEWLLSPDRASIIAFLKGPVRNFFLGQSLAERGEPWPFGERKHHVAGLVESYSEMIGTNDRVLIERYLACLSQRGLKGHWECPCGSGKHVRSCHIEELKVLREKIPYRVAEGALQRLRSPH